MASRQLGFEDGLSFYGSADSKKSGDAFGLISLGPTNPAGDCATVPQKPSAPPSSVQQFLFGKALSMGSAPSSFPPTRSTSSAFGSSAEWTAKGSAPPRGTLNGASAPRGSTSPQEGHSLLASSVSAVKDGASRILGGAQSVVTSTTQSVMDNPLSTQHLLLFGLVAGVGVLFMFLAFLTLPLLVFAPSKFALLFTMGSLCFMVSLAMLRGVKELGKHLSAPARLPFTVAYGLSLGLTLYATLWAKSYVLTLVFSVVQLLALASFLVSYIPGGKHMLKFVGGAVWQMIKRACNCKDARDLQLPL